MPDSPKDIRKPKIKVKDSGLLKEDSLDDSVSKLEYITDKNIIEEFNASEGKTIWVSPNPTISDSAYSKQPNLNMSPTEVAFDSKDLTGALLKKRKKKLPPKLNPFVLDSVQIALGLDRNLGLYIKITSNDKLNASLQ